MKYPKIIEKLKNSELRMRSFEIDEYMQRKKLLLFDIKVNFLPTLLNIFWFCFQLHSYRKNI